MSEGDGMNIDWDLLRGVANDATSSAYVPYSKFPVGAAALVDDAAARGIAARQDTVCLVPGACP